MHSLPFSSLLRLTVSSTRVKRPRSPSSAPRSPRHPSASPNAKSFVCHTWQLLPRFRRSFHPAHRFFDDVGREEACLDEADWHFALPGASSSLLGKGAFGRNVQLIVEEKKCNGRKRERVAAQTRLTSFSIVATLISRRESPKAFDETIGPLEIWPR